MKFLVSQDSQVAFALKRKTIPTLIGALDDPRLHTADMKQVQYYFDAAKGQNLQGFPNSVYIKSYLQSLTEETEKAFRGKLSPQAAMDHVAERIQPLADSIQK